MVKKFSSQKTILLLSLTLIVLSGFLIYLTSSYRYYDGFSYKLIKHSVEINAPVEKTFKFLGNSDNAAKWSVFVNHITPINLDSFPDGSVGSRRRCFQNLDEQGIQWDELITDKIINAKRQLIIYNMKNFPITAEHLATEQIYDPIDSSTCKLTFTLFFKDAKPSLLESLKTYLASFKIKTIFKQNMTNIKHLIETAENE